MWKYKIKTVSYFVSTIAVHVKSIKVKVIIMRSADRKWDYEFYQHQKIECITVVKDTFAGMKIPDIVWL